MEVCNQPLLDVRSNLVCTTVHATQSSTKVKAHQADQEISTNATFLVESFLQVAKGFDQREILLNLRDFLSSDTQWISRMEKKD